MQDLIKQEKFELEVLEKLNSTKILPHLIFDGGTMMRLCYGLHRFSVDLDFWLAKKVPSAKIFKGIRECLSDYAVKKNASKLHALLLEIKSGKYPRTLKLEIRRQRRKVKTEKAIAYSKYSNSQVFVRVVSLPDMMKEKVEAFINRGEIRDLFDIEFLLKKGVALEAPKDILLKLLKGVDSLTKNDYEVKLCSLLDDEQKAYYNKQNFKLLKLAINDKINDEKEVNEYAG